MHLMRPADKMSKGFIYKLLWAVYTSFFTVEVGANYFTSASAHVPCIRSQGKISGIKYISDNVKKIIIRLNKRFYPEFSSECPFISTVVPVIVNKNVLKYNSVSPHVINNIFNYQHRRGPPAIV